MAHFAHTHTHTHSAEQLVERQKVTARKRRKNQNVEIEELGALIPVSEGPGKQALDKISVLRLASTYMRFRKFVESGKSFVYAYLYSFDNCECGL